MPVDARRRFEMYVAFEPALGETTATFMEFLREVAESPEWQRWNHERFRKDPKGTYVLYSALRRVAGADAAATVMEIMDPIAWAESWPLVDAAAERERVAGASEGGDHDS